MGGRGERMWLTKSEGDHSLACVEAVCAARVGAHRAGATRAAVHHRVVQGAVRLAVRPHERAGPGPHVEILDSANGANRRSELWCGQHRRVRSMPPGRRANVSPERCPAREKYDMKNAAYLTHKDRDLILVACWVNGLNRPAGGGDLAKLLAQPSVRHQNEVVEAKAAVKNFVSPVVSRATR